MKITVSEALRIKKEVAEHIRAIEYNDMRGRSYRLSGKKDLDIYFGETWENHELMHDEGKISVSDRINNVSKILDVSEDLNRLIAVFNHKNDVGILVRKRQNLKFLLNYYEEVVSKNSVPSAKSVRDKDTGKVTKVVFKPSLSKAHIRNKIKGLRSDIRKIQADLDNINTQTIDIPYEYDDIYDLMNY